ncbi:hypothetical protein LIER_27814 [Lithospermum erythrorhizon]|uniref:Reverse transcriptase domain-containing protein n=1 Tax=Lithospermum erythrorhizon TaxID=34254 RepID=A0AAV3RGD0_LITER
MSALDPKVAVHHLAVTESLKPVKQAQQRSERRTGQIRVCVDFRDLNHACPKDDFALPIPELMIDATTGHEALTFMDVSSEYNQIRMALEDEELTAFRTPKGVYCYKVMPFGLKNAGATYQRPCKRCLMIYYTKTWHAMWTTSKLSHVKGQIIPKMNPLKCAFGVASGKFLGFVVRRHGIDINRQRSMLLRHYQSREICMSLKAYKANWHTCVGSSQT